MIGLSNGYKRLWLLIGLANARVKKLVMPENTWMSRSLGGKHNQTRGSLKPGRRCASLIEILWLSAALLSSSLHANSGARMVTSTFACCAKFIARVLFIVDNPPFDDPHSFAKRATFKIKCSAWLRAVVNEDWRGCTSCNKGKINSLKQNFGD